MAYLYCYFSFIFNTSNRQNFSHRSIIYEFIKVFGYWFLSFYWLCSCLYYSNCNTKQIPSENNANKTIFVYSIYLMHWLIVVYVMEHWEKWLQLFPTPQITFFAMLLISFLATIISATMLYYTVERPFINLGKKINL